MKPVEPQDAFKKAFLDMLPSSSLIFADTELKHLIEKDWGGGELLRLCQRPCLL